MSLDCLDIITTILGLIYIWLEYRAHIALWIVGIIMPALDIWLYWTHGLYGDAGMAMYYTLAALYGYVSWKLSAYKAHKSYRSHKTHDSHSSQEPQPSQPPSSPITHLPLRLYLPATGFFFAAWAATYYILITWTNSTVPLLDSFTNALSFVGLWALARKYIEQWFFWIIIDIVCCYLYATKGIPFKSGLYGLYVIIAIAGYFKWKQMMHPTPIKSPALNS